MQVQRLKRFLTKKDQFLQFQILFRENSNEEYRIKLRNASAFDSFETCKIRQTDLKANIIVRYEFEK